MAGVNLTHMAICCPTAGHAEKELNTVSGAIASVKAHIHRALHPGGETTHAWLHQASEECCCLGQDSATEHERTVF